MAILYILVVFFVTCLLLCLPLFPFWKVWIRVRDHHQDLWNAKGPFPPQAFLRNPDLLRSFLDIVSLAEHDEILKDKDPELIKWCRVSLEVWRMLPRSFMAQLGTFILFLYFVGFLSSLVMDIFR